MIYFQKKETRIVESLYRRSLKRTSVLLVNHNQLNNSNIFHPPKNPKIKTNIANIIIMTINIPTAPPIPSALLISTPYK